MKALLHRRRKQYDAPVVAERTKRERVCVGVGGQNHLLYTSDEGRKGMS